MGSSDESLINKVISDSAEYLISSAPAADPRWGGADVSLPVTLGQCCYLTSSYNYDKD